VTISDGTNNLTSQPVSLSIVPRPSAPVITLNGNQLVSDHSTGNQWYINGNLIPNATSQTYTPSTSGDYTATVSDPSNNCESAHSNYITWLITGQVHASPADQVVLYPNPAKERIIIDLPATTDKTCTIVLQDASGRVVMTPVSPVISQERSVQVGMDIRNLAPGIYFCVIQADTWHCTKKFIITQ
jgi:hypothetical protein